MKDVYYYTVDEVAETLGLSITTLRTAFPRTVKNLKKQGILLKKWGVGDEALYTLEAESVDGGMTLEECAEELGVSETTLKSAFKRTRENYKKWGIDIKKEGGLYFVDN